MVTSQIAVERTRPGRPVAWWRLPLLAGAAAALAAGIVGGLALLVDEVPAPASFTEQHGPLMALGFLGTLIALERAVALRRAWGYAAPALAAAGAVALAAGAEQAGRLALTAAGGWLVGIYLALLGRRRSRETFLQLGAALAWPAAGLLWLGGRPVPELVPWFAAFLVATIAAERLELAHVVFLRRAAWAGLLAATAVVGAGAVMSPASPVAGARVAGAGMVAVAAWLALHDVARRTVRGCGLPRYAAVCLLAGYGWLAAAGALWAVTGLASGGYLYDAALHALFLGFVMSMVFAHAPVILPALLRVPLPYRPVLYLPLAALHVAVAVRVAGDLAAADVVRTLGGVLAAPALLMFAGCVIALTRSGRSREVSRLGPVDIRVEKGRPPLGGPPPPPRPRASWHLRANAIVVGWLGLTVAVALAGGVLPAPRWLLIHVFLLGAVSTAILIWSEHFTVALLRARSPSQNGSLARLALLNAATLAVLAGVTSGSWQPAAAGAALMAAVVLWHAAVLVRLARRALPGRFGHVIGWYVAAAAALAAGATLGGLLTSPLGQGAVHERLHAAHAEVNLLGWVGLTVLGTLFTLWPTVLRTRMSDRTRRASRIGLWLTAPGLAVTVAGLLAGWRWAAVAGLAAYAVGGLTALAPLADALRRRRPHTGAAWMLGAAIVWFEVALAVDLVITATRPAGEVAGALSPLLPIVLAGFVAQVLLGSLLHLLPAVLGGGPARFKENAALLERGWAVRLAALNLGVPLLALPVPQPIALLGWALVLGSILAFVALAVTTLGRARHAGARDRGTWRPSMPAVAGVAAGCLLTAAAVVVATTSGPEPAATVTVTGSRTVEVTLSGMSIRPGVIEAPVGTVLTLRITNADAQRHDLRLSTGPRTPMLSPGSSAVLTLDPLAQPVDGWCTVAGHRAAGMTMRIVPTRTTTPPSPAHDQHSTTGTSLAGRTGEPTRLDLTAPMSPGWTPYDATLEPAPGGTEHHIELRADDTAVQEVAPGVRQRVWTFNGTMPGPVLRGKVGDVFVVTFVNGGTMGHGIDFHAGAVAPDGPMRTIQPGERLTYRFRADFAGAWLYHCSTMPMTQHIANGMYGAVIVDPPDLPAVDREYLLVQGELYLAEPGSEAQAGRIRQGTPDGWMFNGTAAGYDHAPLRAGAGERVRIWAVAAGPSSGTALHVVGAPFDTVYKEGAYVLRKNDPGGAQVLDLAPAQGGFAELVFPEAGTYPVIDHTMRQAEGGAHGLFQVSAR
ncbi:multicopper oxidase domain-containing protein [Nonomuraea phyllanthi]|uniref:multicopper oxidase domain-containing protein n=1 Tax=Nonomuraea phyllanthi TaxID=2219224 RepID=UPI001D020C4D|nr:multicopper oxidase domain-containing protein [Nonomuraea phyllanthi]